MSSKIVKLIKRDLALKKRFFTEAEKEIAKKNIVLLKIVSLCALGLLCFFLLTTKLIIRDWTPSLQHMLFVPAVMLFCVFILLFAGKLQKNSHGERLVQRVNLLCLAFETILYIFIILIDVFSNPGLPSSFMPVICVAFAALFILPQKYIFSIIVFFEIVYILCVFYVKETVIGQHDIFNSLVGMLCAFTVAEIILRLRVQDYIITVKYERLSKIDPLSGLLNKAAGEEKIKRTINVDYSGVGSVLFVLDIDNFKEVNDKLGHLEGDSLIKSTGAFFTSLFSRGEIAVRFGGDEFLIFVPYAVTKAELEDRCRVLQNGFAEIARPLALPSVTLSIGAVFINQKKFSYSSVFKQADQALYEAKSQGKNRYIIKEFLAG